MLMSEEFNIWSKLGTISKDLNKGDIQQAHKRIKRLMRNLEKPIIPITKKQRKKTGWCELCHNNVNSTIKCPNCSINYCEKCHKENPNHIRGAYVLKSPHPTEKPHWTADKDWVGDFDART